MSHDLLDSRKLVAALMDSDASVSRAGRNCSVGLRRNPQTARKPAAGGGSGDDASPSASGGSGGGHSPLSSLSARGTGATAREKAAVKALNITSSANDHKRAFGRGVADDDGKRHELCSSPRPHPELDRFLLSEFQEGRRAAFEDIQGRVSAMQLVDAEAVEEELAARGVRSHTSANNNAPLPELSDDADVTSEQHNTRSPRDGVTTPRKVPPLALVPSPPKGIKSTTTGGGASPRPKKDNISAAFSAPERFRERKNAPMLPEVGYYRPKYGAVHSRVAGGLMQPAGSMTSRVPKAPEPKDEAPPMSDVLRGAREEVRPRALKERAERRAARALRDDDDDDDGGLTPKKKSAGFPEPSRDSSPPFRSKVAGTQVAARPSAAPDTMYWPIAENGTFGRATAAVDFSKQTPRPPLAGNAVLPDPRSVVTSFGPDAARNAPDIGKYSPRKGVEPRHPVPDAPLHPERADTLRYGRPLVADFTSSPLNPRGRSGVAGARQVNVVSVETVERIIHPGDKALPSPRFDKATPRKGPKPPLDLPPLNLSYDAVDHRPRGAIVRPDAGGHGSVFAGTSSNNNNGGSVAEVGQYNPNVDAVRPKMLRSVDFAKATPRKDATANMADLTYDVKSVSPRTLGNPMIAQQVSRTKREAVLGAKSAAADVTYDVTVPSLTGLGMCDIGRQVTRANHAPGRVPAQRAVDRERKQQDAAAAAATARLDEKRARHASRSPARS